MRAWAESPRPTGGPAADARRGRSSGAPAGQVEERAGVGVERRLRRSPWPRRAPGARSGPSAPRAEAGCGPRRPPHRRGRPRRRGAGPCRPARGSPSRRLPSARDWPARCAGVCWAARWVRKASAVSPAASSFVTWMSASACFALRRAASTFAGAQAEVDRLVAEHRAGVAAPAAVPGLGLVDGAGDPGNDAVGEGGAGDVVPGGADLLPDEVEAGQVRGVGEVDARAGGVGPGPRRPAATARAAWPSRRRPRC